MNLDGFSVQLKWLMLSLFKAKDLESREETNRRSELELEAQNYFYFILKKKEIVCDSNNHGLSKIEPIDTGIYPTRSVTLQ